MGFLHLSFSMLLNVHRTTLEKAVGELLIACMLTSFPCDIWKWWLHTKTQTSQWKCGSVCHVSETSVRSEMTPELNGQSAPTCRLKKKEKAQLALPSHKLDSKRLLFSSSKRLKRSCESRIHLSYPLTIAHAMCHSLEWTFWRQNERTLPTLNKCLHQMAHMFHEVSWSHQSIFIIFIGHRTCSAFALTSHFLTNLLHNA